ncbi:MAG: extracellular solute-binding protein [Clostridiales bacterium]|nr:extracellular solute-binding protein [Clostridiales bacterium]
MKKKSISLLLAATTLLGGLGLSSCGDKAQEPELSRVTNVYKSTDIDIPGDARVSNLTPTDNGVSAYCTEYIERPDGGFDLNQFMLDIGLDGSQTRSDIKLPNEYYVSGISAFPDGGYLIVVNSYDEETYESTFKLLLYKDGTYTTLCDDLEQFAPAKNETDENSMFFDNSFYVQSIAIDKDSNIYLATYNMIIVLDKDMNKLFDVQVNGDINSVSADSNGRVFASYVDYSNNYHDALQYIDVSKRDFGEPISLPSGGIIGNGSVDFYVGPGYDIYIKNRTALYGYNEADGEPVELLNWLNSDIDSEGIQNMAIIDKDTVVASYYSYDGNSSNYELYLLKHIPDEEVPERYVINLAVNYLNYGMRSTIVRFNRNNDKYRVVVNDYNQYNTDDDYERAETTLQNEIISGNTPDIVMISDFSNKDTLIASGAFADLYELMDKDKTFDRSKIFKSVMTSTEIRGKLYELPTEFYISTMVAKKSNVDRSSWTASEFIDYAHSLPDGTFLMDYSSRDNMLMMLFALSLNDFIDYNKGTCNFDCEEFRKILEFAKEQKDDFNYRKTLSGDDLEDYQNDYNKPYREDKIILKEDSIYSFADYLNLVATGFGKNTELSFVGIPTGSGRGVMLNANNSYAIGKKSPVKEGAWSFIRYMLENSALSDRHSNGFSSYIEAFEKKAEMMFDQHFFFDINGMGYSSWTGDRDNDDFYLNREDGVRRDITQQDIDSIRAMIEDAKPMASMKIIEMINEDLAMYFSDEKSLDETIKIIQSRVGIYIGENS